MKKLIAYLTPMVVASAVAVASYMYLEYAFGDVGNGINEKLDETIRISERCIQHMESIEKSMISTRENLDYCVRTTEEINSILSKIIMEH